mmetsp:Transcript_9671/g.23638  ORF Transcript_9671/g.23638 Transcript_9671/m.23638 type:complete len:212 (+) Transcript_9671:475-1110(+)
MPRRRPPPPPRRPPLERLLLFARSSLPLIRACFSFSGSTSVTISAMRARFTFRWRTARVRLRCASEEREEGRGARREVMGAMHSRTVPAGLAGDSSLSSSPISSSSLLGGPSSSRLVGGRILALWLTYRYPLIPAKPAIPSSGWSLGTLLSKLSTSRTSVPTCSVKLPSLHLTRRELLSRTGSPRESRSYSPLPSARVLYRHRIMLWTYPR